MALSILKKMEDEERYAKEQSLVLMLRIACILSVAVFLVLAIVLGLMARQNWSIPAKCVAACVLIAIFVLISFGIWSLITIKNDYKYDIKRTKLVSGFHWGRVSFLILKPRLSTISKFMINNLLTTL